VAPLSHELEPPAKPGRFKPALEDITGPGIDAPLETPSVRDNSTGIKRDVNLSPKDTGRIMDTAHTVTGRAVLGSPKGTDLVVVQGCEMFINNAVRMGILKPVGDGFVETTKEDHRALAAQEQDALDKEGVQPDEAPHDHIQVDDETHEELTGMMDAVREIGASPAQTVAQLLVNPNRLPDSLEAVAEARGMNKADVLSYVQSQYAKVDGFICEWLNDRGVSDPKAFFGHAYGSQGKVYVHNAISRAVLSGHTDGLLDMVRSYQRASNHGQPLKNLPSGHGSDEITINGISTTRAAAKHLGWL